MPTSDRARARRVVKVFSKALRSGSRRRRLARTPRSSSGSVRKRRGVSARLLQPKVLLQRLSGWPLCHPTPQLLPRRPHPLPHPTSNPPPYQHRPPSRLQQCLRGTEKRAKFEWNGDFFSFYRFECPTKMNCYRFLDAYHSWCHLPLFTFPQALVKSLGSFPSFTFGICLGSSAGSQSHFP